MFDFLFKNGCFFKGKFYSCLYLKNSLNYCRLGIVVKKKYGNSVYRNYEKRIIREFFRTNKDLFRDNYDIVIILHRKSDSFVEKRDDYLNIITRIV